MKAIHNPALDLNLIKVFDALLETRNVSRAEVPILAHPTDGVREPAQRSFRVRHQQSKSVPTGHGVTSKATDRVDGRRQLVM